MSTLKTKNIQHPSASGPAIALNPNGTFTADIEDLSAESLHGGTFSLRNKLINGSFDIWQRGTTFSTNEYTADRWKTAGGGASNRVFGPDGVTTYAIQIANAGDVIRQFIELPAIGRAGEYQVGTSWTLSWYQSNTSVTQSINLQFRDDAANTGGSTVMDFGTPVAVETVGSWTRYKAEITITQSPVSTNECLRVYLGNSGVTNTQYTGIQFEKGGLTALEVRPKGMELSLCQRYFIRLNYPDSSYAALGSLQSSASPRGAVIHYPVSMRKPAQAADVTFSGVGTTPGNLTFLQPNTANPTTVGSLVGLGNSTESLHVYGNGFTSIGSIGQTSVLYAYAGSWIEITAEF